MATEPELQISAKMCSDPRLVSSAKLLDVSKITFLGALIHLLCQAEEYAEDGDLWRGDEESSIRFIAALADWPDEAFMFVHVLRREGWIDEWMIAEWLRFAGDYFYRKYKTNSRNRLVEIHAKNGREYGKKQTKDRPDAARLQPLGCFRGVTGLQKKHPLTHNPKTLIPSAPDTEKNKNPPQTLNSSTQKGGDAPKTGGDESPTQQAVPFHKDSSEDFLDSLKKGLLEQGVVLTQDQLDGSGLTHLEVFEAFKPVLVFHSIVTIESLYFRCQRCKCLPAWWIMIYLDKVHAVYRDRGGKTWLEEGADPVAMTMAAILPSYGRRHTPSEAARQLFLEIMIDYQRKKNGEPARWAGNVSGNFITKELELRKGKAGKLAS